MIEPPLIVFTCPETRVTWKTTTFPAVPPEGQIVFGEVDQTSAYVVTGQRWFTVGDAEEDPRVEIRVQRVPACDRVYGQDLWESPA